MKQSSFLIASVGQEVQRASVISNLPSLVRQNPAETFRRVVPKVRVCMVIQNPQQASSYRCTANVSCLTDSGCPEWIWS